MIPEHFQEYFLSTESQVSTEHCQVWPTKKKKRINKINTILFAKNFWKTIKTLI